MLISSVKLSYKLYSILFIKLYPCDINFQVKKELLPCLRSFTSSLRVAELVWNEGTLIKDYPPESYEIKCMDDTWEYLKTENAVPKFESYIRGWMKQIQELLLESEQLRLETDDAGPQVYKLYKINRNNNSEVKVVSYNVNPPM